jgi:hypothetical protein
VWWIRTTAGRFVCILINLGDAPFEISVGDSIAGNNRKIRSPRARLEGPA